MSKKSPVLYMLLRPPVTAIFRLAVMPKIEGKENIPKNSAAVLAGNHTSSFDCFMLMSSTRRCIHFLAKDELFKGPLKYFFGGAGIIPVNRRQKDRAALSSAEKPRNWPPSQPISKNPPDKRLNSSSRFSCKRPCSPSRGIE